MAGLVPSAILEQIRSANDIVDVIGACIPLKRAGANFVALCPFHREKTPSFNVNPTRQIFHCFGCHKGGDAFKFVQEYENISFIEAVRRLAQRANIPLEFENTPGQQQTRYLKERLLQIHEQIAQRWQTTLANDAAGQAARDYLARRGVSPEAIQLFRLGSAPDAWDDTVNWARSKGYELPLIEQAGLVVRKPESDHYYDRFRGRLMFPICDEQGRVVAFSGRILTGDEKTAKYINSPETPIFTKGKIFYGLDKSKRAILDAGCAVVCEGQLDLIACYMNGIRNIVAPQGTAFTPEHARILKRYVDEVVLCFDSDAAGQSAAVRVLDSLLGAGLAIRVAAVPAPHDPDSFIKEAGASAFQELITNAEGFFDYYLNQLCRTEDVQTDRGRLAIVNAMGEALHKARSPVLLDTYAQKTAARLGVAAAALRQEFAKVSRQARPEPAETPAATAPETPPPAERPPARELWLLRILFQHEELVPWAAAHLDFEWLQNQTVRDLLKTRFAAEKEQQWKGLSAFLEQIESDSARSLVTEVVADPRPLPDPEAALKGTRFKQGYLEILRDEFIERRMNDLQIQFVQPGVTAERQVEIEREKHYWRAQKKLRLAPETGA